MAEWCLVAVVDVASGEDHYHGPFRSAERAEEHAEKVRRCLEREGVSTDAVDVIVEPLRAPSEWRDYSWVT